MGDIKFTIINEWEGGIPGGSLCFSDNKYLVRFQDGSRKTFNERQEAENFRRLQSLEKGLTRNQYRVIECDIEGEYIEMKLQDNYITKFDLLCMLQVLNLPFLNYILCQTTDLHPAQKLFLHSSLPQS